jgi:hypothetical protein
MVAQTATTTFVRCVDHSELLDEPSSRAKFWKASEVSSTSAMRPSANVTLDTTSMNRRGAERSTPSLRLFVGGVGEGDMDMTWTSFRTIRQFFIRSQSSDGLLTGECRATCHKGRRRLLERYRVCVETTEDWHGRKVRICFGGMRERAPLLTFGHISLRPEGMLTKDDPNEKVAVCRRPVRFV